MLILEIKFTWFNYVQTQNIHLFEFFIFILYRSVYLKNINGTYSRQASKAYADFPAVTTTPENAISPKTHRDTIISKIVSSLLSSSLD